MLFILWCGNLFGKENNTKGEKLLNQLIEIMSSKPNEALKLGFEILELPTEEVHDSIRAFAMVEIGFILDKQGLPAQALSFYLQGLDLLTEIGMRSICGYLLIDIGNIYYNQKRYNLASGKYNEAKKVFESQKFPAGVYTAINNLALIEREKNNYPKAKELFFRALTISEKLPEIPYLKAHSYGYIGDLYKTMGLTDSAISYYDKAMTIEIKENGYNLIGLNYQKTALIMIEMGDTLSGIAKLKLAEKGFLNDYNVFHLIKLYSRLSDLLSFINQKSEALDYLNRALRIVEDEKMIAEQINILKKFNEYYQKSGNIHLLNKNLIKINKLLEKRYETDVTALIYKLDTQNIVDEYKQRIKIKELELERSNFVRNVAIAAALGFFIFLWLLFARYQYKKKYHKQVLASYDAAHANELKIEKLKIEQANRELLVQASLIQSQNDFLFSLKKQLKQSIETSDDGKWKNIKKIISSINYALNKDTTWKQFEEQFIKIHPDFFKKLTEMYPNLTTIELKLCAYHKMKLETKEIASLTALSVRSIQTTRYRIRKKIKLPEETSFQEFINGI